MVAIAVVLIGLMTLFYVGSVVDPVEHLSGLPVLVVNEDSGSTVGTQQVSIGKQVVAALMTTSAVSTRLSLDSVMMPEALEIVRKIQAFHGLNSPRQGWGIA